MVKTGFKLLFSFLGRRYCNRPSLNITAMAGDTAFVTLKDKNLLETEWENHVEKASKHLAQEEVIAVPTDTIYGLAGLAQSHVAVNRIYDIKNRDMSKPIAICVGKVEDVGKWGHVTITKALLNELLPGPVTVVFQRTPSLNPHLNPGTNLVGIRVPNYGFVRDIASHCGQPLALTSANLSNSPSSLSVQEFSSLWPQLAAVFDGGKLGQEASKRSGSTVVDLSEPGFYRIIREGSALRETTEKLHRYGLEDISQR